MELSNNNHSVFSLNYHLVLVVKYRRNVIDDIISARLREIFEYIQPSYNITLQEWNHGRDHVHVLFSAHPNSELTKFLNAYKSASSRLIKCLKRGDEVCRKRRVTILTNLSASCGYGRMVWTSCFILSCSPCLQPLSCF